MIWLWIILLLILSGVISGSETALFSLSDRCLHDYGRSPVKLRRLVHRLMCTPNRVLMTVLIANTAINIAIFSSSYILAEQLQHTAPWAAAACGVGILLAVIALGEIIPKAIALTHAQSLAPFCGTVIAVLQAALSPLRGLLRVCLVQPLIRLLEPSSKTSGPVTKDELQSLVEQSARDGVINTKEEAMLQAVVAANDVRVREIMTPRVDLVSVPIDSSPETIEQMLRHSRRRRFPVSGKDLDDMRGVIYARDYFLHPDQVITKTMRPIHYVPEQANLIQVLRHFRQQHIQFAVVVDEYGGTAGVVAVEDVVAWLMGDVPQAEGGESLPATEMIDPDTYRLSGDLSARLLADRFNIGEMQRHIDTVGGIMLAKLGRLPNRGDAITIGNLTLTVEDMRNRRITRILLHRDNTPLTQGVESS